MWALLQIIVLFPSVVADFLILIYKYILSIKPASSVEADSSKVISKGSHILRKKDYETYQAIKYKAGIKSAAMSGSTLILINLDLIKSVNQKDFSYFTDRHPPSYHSHSTMNKMLSFATGEEWKSLKAILTQAFSTSRIRRVHQSLNESAIKLVDFTRGQLSQANDRSQLEIVGPANKYLLELIACSVFGLEDTGIFSSDNSLFEIYTKEVQKTMIRHRQARLVPGLLRIAKLFNLIQLDPKAHQFFKVTIENSIKSRKDRGEKCDDLLQVLMEAASSDVGKTNNGRLSDEMILSQAFMFFFAGTEGPATLLIYGLYELAMNPDVQKKLYDEIATAVESLGTEMDYETLTNLPYLDMFVCEVLRMYSSGVTARRCGMIYNIPGTEFVIEPGTNVHTPIYGIHHDEEYYPVPFKFNPDNFTPEAKAKRPPGAYIPFGIGPRSCIAQKFGLVQGKSAICHMVYNFKFETCWRTETPPKGSIESMFLPANGLWMKFKDRIINNPL